ncbi:MAG: type IV pilus assembly protein PilM, partial [Bdellovibrionota bacterium]
FEASEVVMDYHVLSRAKDHQTDVILVAVKKSVLELYMDAISAASLKPKIIDVDYFALQNVFEANYPVQAQEAVAIVDIGASAMKCVVVQDGIPVFTKDTGIGGRNLTLEIQRQLNLSYVDAEALKTDSRGGGVPQEVSDLMHIMSENLAGEVKKALDFYNASSSGAPVAYVLLCGGCSKLPNLAKTVEDTVGLPVQLINPFNSVTYDSGVFPPDYIASIAPAAAIPVGLALRAAAR